MSKYIRTNPIVSRQSYVAERSDTNPDWVKDFENNLEKVAVQPKAKDSSLFDQINAIIGGTKSKHQTVEAAVEDMKKRSGLTEYLDKIKSSSHEHATTKNASEEPGLFSKLPHAKNTIENYCSDTNGNLPVPAIVEKIRSIHKNDGCNDEDFDDPKLLVYINNKNIEHKKSHVDDSGSTKIKNILLLFGYQGNS